MIPLITGVNSAGHAGHTSRSILVGGRQWEYSPILPLPISHPLDAFGVCRPIHVSAFLYYSFWIKKNFKFSTPQFTKICHFEITKQKKLPPPQTSLPVGRGTPLPHTPPLRRFVPQPLTRVDATAFDTSFI